MIRLRRPTALHSFTLVELLVVIAILTLLASLLLPQLKRAMESSRRVVCKSNAKQLYTCLVVYSEDHGGFLPNSNGWYNNLANATLDQEYRGTDSKNLPFMNFFSNYVGMKVIENVSKGTPHYFAFRSANEKSILFCPSGSDWIWRDTNNKWWSKVDYLGSQYAYRFSGIGFFSEVTAPANFQLYGGPRLERMGGPAGPVSLLSEVDLNHAKLGLHTVSEKGEVQWSDFPDMIKGFATTHYYPDAWGTTNIGLFRPPSGGLWENTEDAGVRRRIKGYAR